MRVELLVPDAPAKRAQAPDVGAGTFGDALNALGATLQRASSAEDGFARGTSTLQTAIYERARADVALSVATTAAQRAAQALQSIFNLQV